ncbi:MAG: ERI1 exoribonuclease 2, partial [Paramarteilia canceri]
KYNGPPMVKLREAMKLMNLKFEGKEHSGIYDAINTAKLAQSLILKRCHLKITSNLVFKQNKTSDHKQYSENDKKKI